MANGDNTGDVHENCEPTRRALAKYLALLGVGVAIGGGGTLAFLKKSEGPGSVDDTVADQKFPRPIRELRFSGKLAHDDYCNGKSDGTIYQIALASDPLIGCRSFGERAERIQKDVTRDLEYGLSSVDYKRFMSDFDADAHYNLTLNHKGVANATLLTVNFNGVLRQINNQTVYEVTDLSGNPISTERRRHPAIPYRSSLEFGTDTTAKVVKMAYVAENFCEEQRVKIKPITWTIDSAEASKEGVFQTCTLRYVQRVYEEILTAIESTRT